MNKRIAATIMACVILGASAAPAKSMLIGVASQDQMVAWVKEYQKDHPNDAAAYFCLGRIYMTVWASGSITRLEYAGRADKSLPAFSPWSTVILQRADPVALIHLPVMPGAPANDPQTRPAANDLPTLLRAVEAYQTAVSLDGNKPLYRLALGCAYEELATVAVHLPPDFDWGKQEKLSDAESAACTRALADMGSDDPAVRDQASEAVQALMPRVGGMLLRFKSDDQEVKARVANVIDHYFLTLALDQYRQAYTATVADDLKAQNLGQGDARVSVEAGTQMLALFKTLPGSAKKGEAPQVSAAVDEISKKPVLQFDF